MLATHKHPGTTHPSYLHAIWFFLERIHPSLTQSFFLAVLPLSILPPAMLYYAGTHYGDAFVAGFGNRDWSSIALLFLVAELVTVALMGFVIRGIAFLNDAEVSLHDAQLLAFAAPTPLWLSSLSLFVPSLAFSVIVCSAAFALACLIIFHGIEVLLHIDEDVKAANIAYGIMGVGAIAWALLMIIVIPVGY